MLQIMNKVSRKVQLVQAAEAESYTAQNEGKVMGFN